MQELSEIIRIPLNIRSFLVVRLLSCCASAKLACYREQPNPSADSGWYSCALSTPVYSTDHGSIIIDKISETKSNFMQLCNNTSTGKP